MALAATAYLVVHGRGAWQGAGVSIGFGVVALVAVRTERERWGGAGLASPLSLYAVSWFAFLGLAGLGSFSGADRDPRINYDPEALVRSLAVALASLVLVAIGYRLATAGARRPRDHPVRTIRPTAIVACLTLGWLCRGVRLQLGDFGYLSFGQDRGGLVSSLLTAGDGLIGVAMVVLAYGVWRPGPRPTTARRAFAWLLAANVAMLVVTAIASGVKGQLITDLVPVGVMYLLLRRRLPWKAFAALAAYVIVVLPPVQAFRADLAGTPGAAAPRSGIVAVPREAVGRVAGSLSHLSASTPGDAVDHVVSEYAGVNLTLAAIIEQTPTTVPFLGTRRLVAYPLFVIPSQSLQGGFNVGQYVSSRYLGIASATSNPPTQPGDLYMSGGWPAVVIGEIVVGLVLGAAWRLTGATGAARRMVLYSVWAAMFVNAGLDFGTLLRSGLQTLVVVGLLTRWLLRTADDDAAAAGTVAPAGP